MKKIHTNTFLSISQVVLYAAEPYLVTFMPETLRSGTENIIRIV